jgi:hypothetical protein
MAVPRVNVVQYPHHAVFMTVEYERHMSALPGRLGMLWFVTFLFWDALVLSPSCDSICACIYSKRVLNVACTSDRGYVCILTALVCIM